MSRCVPVVRPTWIVVNDGRSPGTSCIVVRASRYSDAGSESRSVGPHSYDTDASRTPWSSKEAPIAAPHSAAP